MARGLSILFPKFLPPLMTDGVAFASCLSVCFVSSVVFLPFLSPPCTVLKGSPMPRGVAFLPCLSVYLNMFPLSSVSKDTDGKKSVYSCLPIVLSAGLVCFKGE